MRCHVRIAKFTMINLAKILAETNDFFFVNSKSLHIYCILFVIFN